MAHRIDPRKQLTTLCSTLVLALLGAAGAAAQPTFDKTFLPNTIGPGSVSQLQFTITNGSPAPATGLAFTDVLPAGVSIATPAAASTDCANATLSAPAGGGTITLSGGDLPGFASCQVFVDVTSSTPGTHMNTSGDLTSSAGNSGTASADLTVATDRPGFAKSFGTDPISLGARSTLTFTIDNSANPSLATFLTFSDSLPTGLAVADPANASTTCIGGTLTATPGSGLIAYSNGTVSAMTTCVLSVDVTGVGVGTHENRSGELSSSFNGPTVSSGFASDTITVTATTLAARKAFLGDPVNPGATVVLEFTLLNRDRDNGATNVTFTDDLDATLSGLVATGLPIANVCGAGSLLSGTGLLTLTGGNLPAQGSCTFSVTLQVPAGAAAGAYPNVTSAVNGDIGGSPVVGDPASETLFVNDAPSLTKTFLTDPVGAGDTVTVEFSVTNSSTTSAATDISFLDNLTLFMSAVSVVSGLGGGVCGGGSTLSTVVLSGDLHLSLSGGNLPASGSCTFPVGLQIPAGQAAGTYLNMTTEISATVDGTTQLGGAASDTLTVAGPPSFSKEFTDDPVSPGGTMTLEFTIQHAAEATADATAISFTDDLNAALTGLAAVGLPTMNVCGAGSTIAGTTLLTFSGGTLAPGASCTFPVTVQVPPAATPGTYTNTTSDLTAMVGGVTTTRGPTTGDFLVSGLELTKEFVGDPTLPGAQLILRFTIVNSTPGTAATGMSFTDNLDAALSGLVAVAPLPANPCGGGSAIAGTSSLTLVGGNLMAGTMCIFDVTVQVPAGAASGSYLNSTSNLIANLGGGPIALPPASDTLVVDADRLAFSKSFTDDPVAPGGTVTLEFTITNLDAANTVDGITFTDDLDATLSGLVATGLPAMNVCGAGSTISGAGLLTLTGGTLGPGGSCTFPVTLQVPAGAAPGIHPNSTSTVAGTITGLPVNGPTAQDDLRVIGVTFAKAFDGPTVAGGNPILTFTITNLDAVNGVANLSFTDDLDATLTGLAATGLPANNLCGAGSVVSGTSLVSLTGGTLGPGGSCMIPVALQVPPGATPGSYPNTTSDLFQAGLPVSPPAIDTLVVEPPPAFSKAFSPAAVGTGLPSTLTFTIDNTGSAVAASGLDFTDNLPAGLAVATPANPSTTCTGGTVNASPGSGVIGYSGGSVAAGASCTVQANVSAAAPGAYDNTSGDLTSSSGNSGPAMDSLTVEAPPSFSKAFAPDPIVAGGVSTLTFTIDNSAAAVLAASNLDFTDNLPAGLVVASPANASTTCTGGTVTAVPGTAVLSYTGGSVATGASCTVQADVTAAAPGLYDNTSGDLTSSSGNSGPATAQLTVVDGSLGTAKTFLTNPVLPGGTVDLEFTITELTGSFAVTGIGFTDDLDGALPGLVATGLPMMDVCGAGSLLDGTSVLTLTGGNVAAGGSCTFSVTLQVPADAADGIYPNTTSIVTGTAGAVGVSGPPAMADLEILSLEFSKIFAEPVVQGGSTVVLTFVITNPSAANTATGITFTDDLDAVLPGLAAVDTPLADVCGMGSSIDGTSVLLFTGGSLGPGEICMIDVTLLVPVDTSSGTFLNVTSALESLVGGTAVAGASTEAPLTVESVLIAIPTLGRWGILLLGALLALAAVVRMRARL